ncbi:MAG TPA: hypothetical protein VM554_00630 [Acidisarcina sp.]|nr:hypothetical protein [Acidisarcina sp.]
MTTEELAVEELRARVKALDNPIESPQEEPAIKDLTHKEDKNPSMWRSLLQLRVLLPYLSRLVPLLDGTAHQPSTQSHELQHGLAEVQSGHKEIRGQLLEQTVQLKRVEEQLERLRETTERNTLEQQELIEDLKSFGGTLKAVTIAAMLLLLANGGLVVYLLVRLRH